MNKTDFIWLDGKVLRWDDAAIHPLTHGLHYGGCAFEGIRCYQTPRGPAVFRLREHMDRLHYSASTLRMTLPYSAEELCRVTLDLIKKNNLTECYIRPIAYFAYGIMGLNPSAAPISVMVAVWPWGRYLPHDLVDVKTSSWMRIHPKSLVPDAKIGGHYVNSMNAVLEIKGTKYHEVLLLDYCGKVAEGPGENFFIVKNGVLKTPKLGTILAGITRRTAMDIAKRASIPIEEVDIDPSEIAGADEAFFTGTAAEIVPIRSLDDRLIGKGECGPVTSLVKDTYGRLVRGEESWGEEYLARV